MLAKTIFVHTTAHYAAMRKFQVATEEEIKNARTTDVYFLRTKEILEKEGLAELSPAARTGSPRGVVRLPQSRKR